MDLHDEIKVISDEAIREALDNFEPVQFPEVQKVEVTNFPEQKAPIVNVEAPIIPAPKVEVKPADVVVQPNNITVDTSAVAEKIGELKEALKDLKPETDDEKEVVKAIEDLGEKISKIKITGLGGGGVSKYLLDKAGGVLNPAMSGEVSTNNSTTTALDASATYTGTGEQNLHAHVVVYCIADQAGTLFLQWSNDDVTYHDFPTAGIPVSANIPKYYPAVKAGRYFRAKFTNGSVAQSSFSLKTYYGSNFVPSVSALNQAINLSSPSLITRPTFPWLDLSRNLVTGMSVIKKFGRNPAVGTSFVPVTFGGNYRTPQSGSATTLRIKAGGNANDTADGSGAREITLIGLDENFDEVTETLATNGASASSATTTTFTRLYRWYVSKSGTYATQSAGSHAANITIENGAGGTDWSVIDATDFPKSQSEIGAYSVPTGYTAHVFINDITVDSNKSTNVIFFHRGGIDETAAPYTAMRAKSVLVGLKTNFVAASNKVPIGPFTGPCDIGFLAKVDSATASVAVEFEIFLINE